MLFTLRHPAVICSDDKECQIDGANSSDHVAHEIFMARDINDACLNSVAVWRGCIQCSETKIDGDLSLFLLWQTIGIGAGQRCNQRAFAMINVARCGDDKMPR